MGGRGRVQGGRGREREGGRGREGEGGRERAICQPWFTFKWCWLGRFKPTLLNQSFHLSIEQVTKASVCVSLFSVCLSVYYY